MSDWFATHSTGDSVNNGLDMEMPDGLYLNIVRMQDNERYQIYCD